VAIEDNGYSPEFKPSLIRSDVTRNWSNAPVSSTSSDRNQTLKGYINPSVYAGAPYIRQLSSDEVLLSFQSTANRQAIWDMGSMQVAVSDDNGTTFNRVTIPFDIPITKRALWNSVAIVNGNAWALTSTNAYNTADHSEIIVQKSRIIDRLILKKSKIVIDGILENQEYGEKTPVFIGHKWKANASIGIAENEGFICLAAIVTDNEIVINNGNDIKIKDGITFLIDTNDGLAPNIIYEKIFAITVTSGGEIMFEEGHYGSWEKRSMTGFVFKTGKTQTGYSIELMIPLAELGQKVSDQIWGFNASLNNDSENYNYRYNETISGSNLNDPSTWCPFTIPR
jgi:hypothetical protein